MTSPDGAGRVKKQMLFARRLRHDSGGTVELAMRWTYVRDDNGEISEVSWPRHEVDGVPINSGDFERLITLLSAQRLT